MTMPQLRQSLEEIELRSPVKPEPSGRLQPTRIDWRSDEGSRGIAADIWLPEQPSSADHQNGAAAASSRLPLIVYVPGWDGTRRDNVLLVSDLVSRGYAVAAIDDIGAEQHPDLQLETFSAKTEAQFQASVAIADARLKLMTARVSGLLDALARASAHDVIRRLDLERVGILGFSFGGSVAAEMRLLDPRIAAAVNMDGWLFGRARGEPSARPFLVFNSDVPADVWLRNSWSDGKRAIARFTLDDRHRQLAVMQGADTYTFLVRGSRHEDFTDDLFSVTLGSFLRAPFRRDQDRRDLHTTKCDYVAAFFDAALRGAPRSDLLTATEPRAPALQWLASLPKELRELPPS